MSLTFRSPETNSEWEAYYHFRWQQLRQPWQQPLGSEKDEVEETAQHVFIIDNAGSIHGCGRLHLVDFQTGQIRFMAVSPGYRAQGLGKKILQELESIAQKKGLKKIILHARENAISFYTHLGYIATEPSHTLFGTIPHMKMEKQLDTA